MDTSNTPAAMPDMKSYIGTKPVKARPMNRGTYNAYRGWLVPFDEDPADEGYLVEYFDGGKANHSEHEGYISWSPKDVFERAYVETGTEADSGPLQAAAGVPGGYDHIWEGACATVVDGAPVETGTGADTGPLQAAAGVPYSYDPAREARIMALNVIVRCDAQCGTNATTLIHEAKKLAAFIEGIKET